MPFKLSLAAAGLVVAAMVAVFGLSLALSPIDKPYETDAKAEFIALGTLTSPSSALAPSLVLKEEHRPRGFI
jgi:hypothetical protein